MGVCKCAFYAAKPLQAGGREAGSFAGSFTANNLLLVMPKALSEGGHETGSRDLSRRTEKVSGSEISTDAEQVFYAAEYLAVMGSKKSSR